MAKALNHVVDALDVETFLYCGSESEARRLATELLAEMNLPVGDIVFLEFNGLGARVRLRSYLHHPGDHYRWLAESTEERS